MWTYVNGKQTTNSKRTEEHHSEWTLALGEGCEGGADTCVFVWKEEGMYGNGGRREGWICVMGSRRITVNGRQKKIIVNEQQ
jgi:hypothetical protein